MGKKARKHPAENLAQTAKDAGVPREQLENFLSAGYIPQPKQLQFHAACRQADRADGPDQIGYGGARGGAKSHSIFAQIGLDDCQRFPGIKALYLRKVAKNAREQFEDLRRAVLRQVPHEYNRGGGVITFQNGSRILIGHFRTEAEVEQYLGLEYDIIAIEEATTLTSNKYKTLRDSNRTSKPNFRPRIYATTNPGGVGHVFFKERFVTPHRRGEYVAGLEKQTGYTRFIPATVDDNVFIDSDYRRKLEENVGWKLKAYRYGDWDIMAGQYFSNWRYDVHVCAPWPIPSHWPVWAALDYGFTHPTAVYFLTENDGRIYVIAEHVESKRLPQWHVEAIRAMAGRLGRDLSEIVPFVAGPDVFQQKGDKDAKTIAEQYEEHGITLVAAPNDRVSGWGELLHLLGDVDADPPIAPRLQVFATCARLIETIPALQHDPHRPEDVLKWNIDEDGVGGDDPADGLRYAIMARLVDYEPALFGGERKRMIVR